MAVTSVVVENAQGLATEPFWPGGGSEVTVEFQSNASGGFDVRGIDANNKQVFSGNLLTSQQAQFIETVRTGTAGTLIANQNAVSGKPVRKPGEATADAVVVTGGDPGDGKGPKMYLVPLAPIAANDVKTK